MRRPRDYGPSGKPTKQQRIQAKRLGLTVPAGASSADAEDLIRARIDKGIAEGEFPSWDNPHVRINDFALRSFRDSGDRDYIAARMAFRARIVPQFLWSALQAIEKYFKCIHVLNRVPLPNEGRGLGHDISAAYHLTQETFDLRLSESSKKLIDTLNRSGPFRYLELSYAIFGRERLELDRAVWEIRRYCRVFDQNKQTREDQLRALAEDHSVPYKIENLGGFLEQVLTDVKHPARAALVHQNPYFGPRSRRRVRGGAVYAENAPLWMYPEMLHEVRKYAYLPRAVMDAYEVFLAEREAERKKEAGAQPS